MPKFDVSYGICNPFEPPYAKGVVRASIWALNNAVGLFKREDGRIKSSKCVGCTQLLSCYRRVLSPAVSEIDITSKFTLSLFNYKPIITEASH